MKVSNLFILFLIFSLNACQHESEYISIDNFKIDNSILDNKDQVNLIYSSETPSNTAPLTYFIHLVAVQDKTGDTINILTTFNRGGGNGEHKNEFTFYSFDSEEGKNYFEKMYNSNEESTHKMSELDEINRVVYDKRFDFIAKNNYPTIKGFIEKE